MVTLLMLIQLKLKGCYREIQGGQAMREILFRGKGDTKYNDGDWYEGFLIKDSDGDYQIFFDGRLIRTVVPETVGQYTGLTDRKGNKIFEGDIVKCVYSDCVGIVKFGEYRIGDYGFYIDWQNDRYHLLREDLIFWANDGAIVAGNIYDDPVLLELAK